jgi:hypothetical protein
MSAHFITEHISMKYGIRGLYLKLSVNLILVHTSPI